MNKNIVFVLLLLTVMLCGCNINTEDSPVNFPQLVAEPIYPISYHMALVSGNQSLKDAIVSHSRIVVGQLEDVEYQDNNAAVYRFHVTECLDSVLQGQYIYVYQKDSYLVPETRYMLILGSRSFTEYPIDFYVYNTTYIFHVNDEGSLLRLQDPKKQTFIKPFVEESYNNFLSFKELINSVRLSPPDEEIALETADFDYLVSIADFVIEIEPISVYQINPLAMSMRFRIISTIKGEEIPHNTFVVPLNAVKTGEPYILLLKKTSTPGFVTFVSRKGSIISHHSPHYSELIQSSGSYD